MVCHCLVQSIMDETNLDSHCWGCNPATPTCTHLPMDKMAAIELYYDGTFQSSVLVSTNMPDRCHHIQVNVAH